MATATYQQLLASRYNFRSSYATFPSLDLANVVQFEVLPTGVWLLSTTGLFTWTGSGVQQAIALSRAVRVLTVVQHAQVSVSSASFTFGAGVRVALVTGNRRVVATPRGVAWLVCSSDNVCSQVCANKSRSCNCAFPDNRATSARLTSAQ